MTSTVAWSAVRAETIRAFGGQTPRAEDEQVVIDVFEVMPEAIARHVDEVAKALAEHRIKWAWSVLAKRLQSASEPLRESLVSQGPSRERRIRLAEILIVNALCHCLTEEQVIAELYADGGERSGPLLQDFADDEALRIRMLALWAEKRPAAERSDAELRERMKLWRYQHLRRMIGLAAKRLTSDEFTRHCRVALARVRDEDERISLLEHAADQRRVADEEPPVDEEPA